MLGLVVAKICLPSILGPETKTPGVLGHGKWTLLGVLVKLWGFGPAGGRGIGIEAIRIGIHMSVVVLLPCLHGEGCVLL